jgi:hypothetical protein
MKAWGYPRTDCWRAVLQVVTIGAVLTMSSIYGRAATPVSLENPTSFFTNVASRLLRSQLNLDLRHIQVYPTNQYSASVHRLLQVTANIYDSATNRTYGVPGATNGYPSIFRPLFRRIQNGTNALIIIADYREVTGTGMAGPATAPPLIELNSGNLNLIPPLGSPFRSDQMEVMIAGCPLVIGAKKGFPGFNEFFMQTCFNVARALEFRRTVPSGPVEKTNQMYMVAVSNVFGLEAWNSYSNSYPRGLKLTAAARMTAVITNETGNVLLSNRFTFAATTNFPGGSWSGWAFANSPQNSFFLPWGSGVQFLFLTNSSYINQAPWFVPQTDIFTVSAPDPFYVPRWWLTLNTGLNFILVDTDANRIVDYVNLQHCDDALDIDNILAQGATCILGDLANAGNQWCTNRLHGSTDSRVPTIGILNQIGVGLGLAGYTPDFTSFQLSPDVGPDLLQAIKSFTYNLLGSSPSGQVFYRSNVFYAPLTTYRSIYIHTSWQANDPLVHYTTDDLRDLSLDLTNRINFIPQPLADLGFIDRRYSPWGGNPYRFNNDLTFQVAVKDPMVTRPDDWDFPCSQGLNPAYLGTVHRGTPWQTLFLKSTNILDSAGLSQGLFAWEEWTGNAAVRPNWKGDGAPMLDALATAPTNDWAIVGLLTTLFNTNDLRTLVSVNQTSASSWAGLLDGITVLTNTSPAQFDLVLMPSNSPQALEIATGLNNTHEGEPNRQFGSIGEILATPELSDASPWLNATNGFVSDAALEIIPSQLLPRLRPDSIGSVSWTNEVLQVQFTGIDDYAYAVQVSSNLVDWSLVSTNYPSNGMFSPRQMPWTNSVQTFFRSLLLQ